jgi:putative DNA primase/helicase
MSDPATDNVILPGVNIQPISSAPPRKRSLVPPRPRAENQDTGTNGKAQPKPEQSADPLNYTGADPLDYTDLALAQKFTRRLSPIVIGERVWNEKTREWSKNSNALSLAIYELCEGEAKKLNPRFKKDHKQILSLGSARKVQNVESVVKKLLHREAKWDSDSFLLGVPGGKVVDLRTGEVREARREDYITKYAAVVPADEEDCPKFKQFMSAILPPQVIAYLKRLLGYFLTASVKEEIFVFLYGTGQNGKGTLVKIVVAVLGDYAGILPAQTLLAGKNQRHPTEIAKLEGLRLAAASETTDGNFWNEGKLKALTGGDKQTARKMRQDFSDFEPTVKLMLDSNNKPSLAKVDKGMRRRFHLIPFSVTITEEKRNRHLKEELMTELPGIFRLAINGCLEWQRDGLQPPPEVLGATEEYFEEQDLLGQWIDSHCEIGADFRTSSKSYFASWRAFCLVNGEEAGTQRNLTNKLKQRGFGSCTVGKANDSGLSGFRLKEQTVPDLSPYADEPNGS